MTSSLFPTLSHRARSAHVALVLALVSAGGLSTGRAAEAAPAANAQPPGLSEKVTAEIAKLKALNEAKNVDGMLAVLDGALPLVSGPNSYDLAFIEDMRGQFLAGKEQWAPAFKSRETALRLAETYNFFDKNKRLEMMLFLAQVAYQQATSSKVPAEQKASLDNAAVYFKRYLKDAPKVTPEISSFYASILLQQAVADSKNINKDLLKEARTQVENLFLTSVRPKEQLYFLLLAILQQEGETLKSAEILEIIVKQFPTKKDYWTQLWATYLNLANDKDEAKSRMYFARAINTVERAQAQGFMNTPKDNFNLVSLYIQVNQFGKACDLLYAGLKNGTIDNEAKNWTYLGYYLVQVNKNTEAITVLKEAAQKFPNNGQFDQQIGEIYRQEEKMKEARQHYREALRRGGLDRPHAVHLMLANVAYEMEDFDGAMEAIIAAEAFKDANKDGYLGRLKDAVQAAIAEREAQKPKPAATPAPAAAPTKNNP